MIDPKAALTHFAPLQSSIGSCRPHLDRSRAGWTPVGRRRIAKLRVSMRWFSDVSTNVHWQRFG